MLSLRRFAYGLLALHQCFALRHFDVRRINASFTSITLACCSGRSSLGTDCMAFHPSTLIMVIYPNLQALQTMYSTVFKTQQGITHAAAHYGLLPCRMSRVVWKEYRAPGCQARIPSDSHLHCLRNALCTEGFQPYDSSPCFMCAAASSNLLQKSFLMGLEPQHTTIRHRWSSLAHKRGKTATWVDPDLSILLGFGHPARVSPSL